MSTYDLKDKILIKQLEAIIKRVNQENNQDYILMSPWMKHPEENIHQKVRQIRASLYQNSHYENQ